jgi:NTP pyrophosphatase (non-canonical NTP hydrolase)
VVEGADTFRKRQLMLGHQLEWVANWQEKNKGAPTHPRFMALKALEEMVELCAGAGASWDEITSTVNLELVKLYKKDELKGPQGGFSAKAMGEEIADVAICLAVICHNIDIDGAHEVEKKIPILEQRQWTPDAHGILRRP